MTGAKQTGRVDRLTKRTADAARPMSVRYILWDRDLSGFGLRVEPTGRKTFIARYRAGGGRKGVLRQQMIGKCGTLTVEEARRKAKRLLGQAAGGGDPIAERKAARQAGMTIAEICDWYLEAAVAGRLIGRRGRPIKDSTLSMDRSRIETHVKPLLGRTPVSKLTVADFEDMQAGIAAGRTRLVPNAKVKRQRGAVATGGAGVAARSLGMLRSILEHARRSGLITSNPAAGARKLPGIAARSRLSLDQIRELGKAMRESRGVNVVALTALRFILLSGFRRNEALTLKRADLLPAGGIQLADSKSGPQVRPVGRAAMKLLSSRARSDDMEDPLWLFPAERGEGHFVGLPKVLTRLCNVAGLPPISIHALRHTFASVAAELGLSELVIAGLLGHRAGSVTGRYVHLDSSLVAAADRVADAISGALDGTAER